MVQSRRLRMVMGTLRMVMGTLRMVMGTPGPMLRMTLRVRSRVVLLVRMPRLGR
jgi:hypothetical protein